MQELGTISGRCFVLRNRCPVTDRQAVMLEFNLSQVRQNSHAAPFDIKKHPVPFSKLVQVHLGSVLLHFHEEETSLGLNENLWPLKGTSALVRGLVRSSMSHFFAQKKEFPSIQTMNDVGLDAVWKSTYSPSTFDEFIGCVREGVAGMIRDVLAGKKEMAKDQKGRERKLCWHSGVCVCDNIPSTCGK